MPLRLADKQAIVAEVADIAATAFSAVAAEYRGMTVTEMTALRIQARNNGVYLRVIRNTLARRAVADTDFKCLQSVLTGPVVLAFSQQDPGAAARVVKEFLKTNKKLTVKGVAIGGRLYGAEELERISKMPTRDEAISMLMSVMKAPITKLVRTLAEPHAKLVRTVAAIRDSKQSASA